MTEYGIADLRGKTDRDVIAAMLAITDSRFQDDLLRQRKGRRQDRDDLRAAAGDARDNTPERIDRALAPARDAGLLPPFPFGTDFTLVEQQLLPALARLRTSSPLELAGLIIAGFFYPSRRRKRGNASPAWASSGRRV